MKSANRIALCAMLSLMACDGTHWKTFTSQGGWSIAYPENWHISSCHSCDNPAQADVFVIFEGPATKTDEGVMIYPLADRPANLSVEAWLNQVKHNANQNLIVREAWTTIDHRPALRVLYRYANGMEGDTVYVANGVKTYQIHGMKTEQMKSYAIYRRMVSSFKFVPTS